MAKIQTSGKRLQIDKANSTMLIIVAISAFVVTFSLVAGRALMNTRAYQARVIKQKEIAANQLKANIAASESLVTAYKAFVETPENIIGGNPNGTGERDGDNAKITLDALPSVYDYPALNSSLEKIVRAQQLAIEGIQGTDDEVAQTSEDRPTQPVEMPIQLNVKGDFNKTRDLLMVFERSIRPLKIQGLAFDVPEAGTLEVEVNVISYYQPGKTLKIETKEVK